MTAPQKSAEPGSPATSLLAAGCYALFVVYGSLLPFDYRPRPIESVWRDFLAMPYLELGVESRADWIANILLYLPLAYLLCAAFAAGAASLAARLLRVAPAFALCAALALGVEFTQIVFPPRTVSQNDIAAEFIGSALGVVLWLGWGAALSRLFAQMRSGGLAAIRAAAACYALAYLALSLFPYDFLVSSQEVAEKFTRGGYGWLFAPGACDRVVLCLGRWTGEALAAAPLGALLSMALGRRANGSYAAGAVLGATLGVGIEATQLFIASGASQGLSVASRIAGVLAGVALHRYLEVERIARLAPLARWAVACSAPLYLGALAWANGWFSEPWGGFAQARAGLAQIGWLPFHYHYFTTETDAVQSVLFVSAMYLPVGAAVWLWRAHACAVRSVWQPALVAAPLALAMEAGKLFLAGKHADPTNLLIAVAAAACGYLACVQIQAWALQGEQPRPARRRGAHRQGGEQSAAVRICAALILWGAIGWAAWYYPLGGGWLALGLGVYSALLWRFPGLCLPAVVALLPLLNFAPWSGWLLLSEFDLLLAATLAVRLLSPSRDALAALAPGPSGAPAPSLSAARASAPSAARAPAPSAARAPAPSGAPAPSPPGAPAPGSFGATGWLAIALVAVSFAASAMHGLLPLPRADGDALASYLSGWNSLAILKGIAWPLALLALLRAQARVPGRLERRLAAGMLAGLCAVLAVVVWERAAYAGLLDFAGNYRVEGPFPELHSGGGDIHAYLVMAIPFIVVWAADRTTVLRTVAAAALFLLASYALAVTFTRGGYVGYAGALACAGAAALLHALRRSAARSAMAGASVAVALCGLALVAAIGTGSFMESRLATAQADAATRSGHWQRAVRLMDPDIGTALFGMGLGSFPRTLLAKEPGAASATFSYAREAGNGLLRLGSGRPLYVDQRVDVEPEQRYVLSLDLRSRDAGAMLAVSLCEKSLQYSFRCSGVELEAGGEGWQRREAVIESGEVGSGPRLLRRSVALSLSNPRPGTRIEVDNVRLDDPGGRNLVVNGDFSRGGARWFFSADDHLPWHIFNLWVQVFFEQGWFGVVALALAVLAALAAAARASWRGDLFAGALFAALCGFLLIGSTESLFDGPRITTLFFLLLFSSLARRAGTLPLRRAARAAGARAPAGVPGASGTTPIR